MINIRLILGSITCFLGFTSGIRASKKQINHQEQRKSSSLFFRKINFLVRNLSFSAKATFSWLKATLFRLKGNSSRQQATARTRLVHGPDTARTRLGHGSYTLSGISSNTWGATFSDLGLRPRSLSLRPSIDRNPSDCA